MKLILSIICYYICFANADTNKGLINQPQDVDVLYSNPNFGTTNNGVLILCINGIKYIETITYMKSTTMTILQNKDGKPQICTNKK